MKSIWLHFQVLDQSQLFLFGLPHGDHANFFFNSIVALYFIDLFILLYSVLHGNWIYSQSMIFTQNQTECRRSACNEASSVCFHISNLLFVSLLRKWTWYNLHHDNVFQRLINASTRSFAYIFPDWEALETFVMYSALPCTNCVTLSADIIILWLMLWILSAL